MKISFLFNQTSLRFYIYVLKRDETPQLFNNEESEKLAIVIAPDSNNFVKPPDKINELENFHNPRFKEP